MEINKLDGWVLFGVKILTLTGPSGTGKTSIVKKLLEFCPSFGLVVSLTTRVQRDSDLDGEYLCNKTKEELLLHCVQGRALWVEHAHADHYCTLIESVDNACAKKDPSVMVLIPKVVPTLRQYVFSKGAGVQSFFILPPEEGELRWRIRQRRDADEGAIKVRIAECRRWERDARNSNMPYIFIENPVTDPPDIGITQAARLILEYICRAQ